MEYPHPTHSVPTTSSPIPHIPTGSERSPPVTNDFMEHTSFSTSNARSPLLSNFPSEAFSGMSTSLTLPHLGSQFQELTAPHQSHTPTRILQPLSFPTSPVSELQTQLQDRNDFSDPFWSAENREPVDPSLEDDTGYQRFTSVDGSRIMRRGRHQQLELPATSEDQEVDFSQIQYAEEDAIDKNLFCPICRLPLVDPQATKCDHLFCRECLVAAYKVKEVCPMCQARINIPQDLRRVDRLILNQLDSLLVKCPSIKFPDLTGGVATCEKIVSRSMLKHHIRKYCDFAFVKCPDKECGIFTYEEDHKLGCVHKSMWCPDCAEPVPQYLLSYHRLEDCANRQLICTSCGQPTIRMSLDAHNQVCTETTIPCQYKRYGCSHVGVRKDFELHMLECQFSKVGAIVDTLEATTHQMVETFKVQVKDLQLENSLKDRRIRYLEEYVSEMRMPMLDSNPDLSYLQGTLQGSMDDGNFNSHENHFLPQLESLEGRLTELEYNVRETEARQEAAFLLERATNRQKHDAMRNNLDTSVMHVRWLMNRAIQQQRRSTATTGTGPTSSPGNSSDDPSASTSRGPGRRLSDSIRDTAGTKL